MPLIDFSHVDAAFSLIKYDLSNKDLWYRNEYAQAARMLQDITCRNIFKFEQDRIDYEHAPEYNNIIAISGDRGSGKSTVMYTIIKHLEDLKIKKDLDTLGDLAGAKTEEEKKLANKSFHVLPPLDPSKLPKGETLLGFTIAHIYNDIIEMLKNNPNLDASDFDRILEKFEKTYTSIRIRSISIQKGLEQNPDDLEMLGKLANSSSLRRNLMELVAEYLIIKRKHKGLSGGDSSIKKDFLVIPIDDIDTNIDSGYTLAEEIRHFFFIPQVVILMAVKLEQLTDVIQQHFIKAFEKMFAENVLDAQPEEMATKYIQKLIPDQRRVHLNSLMSHSLDTTYVKTAKEDDEEMLLVDYFFELIRNKSGIILTRNKFGGHGLLPLNLRSLHQMFDLLENMPDVDVYNTDKEQDVNIKNNLQRLEAWVLDSVSSNAVPRGMAIIIKQIASHPNAGFNGRIRALLIQYGIRKDLKQYNSKSEVVHIGLFGVDPVAREMAESEIKPGNICIGDILYLLNVIEKYDSSEGIVHFTASVRFLYSLRLTRALFAEKKANYKAVSSLIGGMIFNPAVQLTRYGTEWMPNTDAAHAKIEIQIENDTATSSKTIYLDGIEVSEKHNDAKIDGAIDSSQTFPAMSLKDAIWLSFFIVHYGSSLRKKRLFNCKDDSFSETVLFRESSDFMGYMSVSWLGYVANALEPGRSVERLLKYGLGSYQWFKGMIDAGSSESPEEYQLTEATEFMKDIIEWKDKFKVALPVYCVDLLDHLITWLHDNRTKIINVKEYIAEFNSFFHLQSVLKQRLKDILTQSITLKKSSKNKMEDNPSYKAIMMALQNFPVMKESEMILAEYKNRKQGDKITLKFDWFLPH